MLSQAMQLAAGIAFIRRDREIRDAIRREAQARQQEAAEQGREAAGLGLVPLLDIERRAG